ncbi:MAG: L-serine ammonia-lyase [Myxococcales bacterium]
MRSLRELFQIGLGPSSSHTMGPHRAALLLLSRCPEAVRVRATLYGSFAATGRGHLTDQAIARALAPRAVDFVWKPETTLPAHPNGLELEGLDAQGQVLGRWRGYSVGGGALVEDGEAQALSAQAYPQTSMAEVLQWCEETGQPMWRLVEEREGEEVWAWLEESWKAMAGAIERGLAADGVLPGGLKLPRKARSVLLKAERCKDPYQRTGMAAAYALAVSEENAAGGQVVTAPTCGSSGILPAVLRFVKETLPCSQVELLRALATAGLVGNLVKRNASISGAEVGCQGEVGTACAMASAAAAFLLGGSPRQVEYAAEMGLEHHLGLTCDPIGGLVQIPCIERNAFGANRALDSADYAMLSDGTHRVSFDEVVTTMKQTGRDLAAAYRETALGGLARLHR